MENFKELKTNFNNKIINSYGRFDVDIEQGKGATAKGKTSSGEKVFIDFTSGIGVNSLGFCDDDWVKAVQKQAQTLNHCSNLYYTKVQEQLAELLTSASGFKKVFFCNSGAEANEGIIKLARKYSFDKYKKLRGTVVTLVNSFHGRTVTTLAATGQDVFHNYFFPFTEGFKTATANDINSVKEAFTDDVCAVLLEPIQGEGGVCPLDQNFVKEVAELCKQNDILLLFDEVQTGIGRTGKFFGYENFGVEADAVSCAKGIAGGLPMGAVLASEKLMDVFTPGTHATTFGGNPICCAGATEVVKKVGNKDFLNDVLKKSEYIKKQLLQIDGVHEVRGFGLMMGFDVDGVNSKEVAAKCAEEGLLILTAKTSIRLLPPLTITKEEIDKGLGILIKTIIDMKEGANK